MRVIDHINGLQTYVKDDGLMVKVKNKYLAWNLKNKIEREGYSVDIQKNQDHYIISIWGAQLMDAYLLKNNEVFAA